MSVTAPAARLVLASASPRRRELLQQLGVGFDTAAADIDESVRHGEKPACYVERLAREKAAAIVRMVGPDAVVLAADTTVAIDDEILGKPLDTNEAMVMLTKLSGRTHFVHTGVAVMAGNKVESAVSTSEVTFTDLGDADIAWYVATGEPFDKAGGYAVQGAGGVFVRSVNGSVSGVIGLPLAVVRDLLGRFQLDLLGHFPAVE